MASEAFWWCHRCRTRVDDVHVTWQEYHEGCGGTCVVLHEEADVFEEARAWQAFRDFLNGTPEQWEDVLHFAQSVLDMANELEFKTVGSAYIRAIAGGVPGLKWDEVQDD